MERIIQDRLGTTAIGVPPQPSAYTGHPRQGHSGQLNRGNCFRCGQPGHGYRFCPAPVQPQQFDNSPAVIPPTVNHFISGSRSAYLPCRVFGKNRWCLLDTGSEVSVIPARCIPNDELIPTSQTLNAANGTTIKVVGEAKLTIELEGLTVTTRGLVSEHVDEILLGLTFLEESGCIWNFKERSIEIQGSQFKLYAHKPTWKVRRIVLQDAVELHPRCQQNIPAKTIYSHLAPSFSDWMSQPIEVATGVKLVRTVVSDKPTDVHVKVINTNDHTVTLPQGLPLGNLEEVQLMETRSTSSDTSQLTDDDTSHVDALLQEVDESVDDTTRAQLQNLLHQHRDVFSRNEYDLGRATMVKHRIETGSSRPFRQALRRQPAHMLPLIDEQLREMQKQGIIRPAQSEWGSNLVVVKKKDGSLRFCVDYRQLNERTIKDTYPLPRIDDCLDTLGGSTWFSTMDLRSGYHQVALDSRDADKTTFITRRGTFAFNVMPFGLCNAPATFQRLMDCTMAGLNYEMCLLYLDDIIVFSRNLDTHLNRLNMVLDRLKQANLKLKPSKCCFLQREVEFLGYKVSAGGIETDKKKIEAVMNWPVPSKLREVRGFLGLCGYYRRFVDKFSEIAAPLHALQKKGTPFVWSEDCQKAFQTLKEKLTEAPILTLPCDQGMFILDTDASNHGIGAVLSQVQDGEERVVSYASRLYSNAEHRYCVTRKELLAVVFFVKYFRQYLLGRHFLLRTDHAALKWLRRTPEPIGQQSRWLEILEEFNFTVEHRPGLKHANADALSRRPCRQCDTCDGQSESQPDLVARAVTTQDCPATSPLPSDQQSSNTDPVELQLSQQQETDPDIGPIMRLKAEYSERPDISLMLAESANTKILLSLWHQLEIQNGSLYRRWNGGEKESEILQIVVPAALRDDFLKRAHTGMCGGHLGVRRTTDQVRRRAFWVGWRRDVDKFCRRCTNCCTYFRGRLPRSAPLQPMLTGAPFERLHVDLTGPHVRSRRGSLYIVTCVDPFTKWAEAFPAPNKEAATVARILVEQVICRFGSPLAILSDRGKEVDGQLMSEICGLLDVDKMRTTAYEPSTNAAVERFHRTMNCMLGRMVEENQRDWDTMLPYVMAAYRSSRHESTQYTPNYLMLGREVYAPVDIVYGCPEAPPQSNYDDYADELEERLKRAYSFVRGHLKKAAERNKRYYDLRVRPQKYHVGDWVYCYLSRRVQGRQEKWCRKFSGPFLVTKVPGPVNVVLQRSKKTKPFCVHIDKVKPYKAENMPRSWLSENDEQCEAHQGNETELQSLGDIPMAGVGGGSAIAGTVPCADISTARPRRQVGRPQRYLD